MLGRSLFSLFIISEVSLHVTFTISFPEGVPWRGPSVFSPQQKCSAGSCIGSDHCGRTFVPYCTCRLVSYHLCPYFLYRYLITFVLSIISLGLPYFITVVVFFCLVIVCVIYSGHSSPPKTLPPVCGNPPRFSSEVSCVSAAGRTHRFGVTLVAAVGFCN